MAEVRKLSSRNQESSSRKHRNSPETIGTPALRPAGIPRFSGRKRVLIEAGILSGSHPFPTTTASIFTPFWLRES